LLNNIKREGERAGAIIVFMNYVPRLLLYLTRSNHTTKDMIWMIIAMNLLDRWSTT